MATKKPATGKDAPVRKDGPAHGAQGNPTPSGRIFGNKWAKRGTKIRNA